MLGMVGGAKKRQAAKIVATITTAKSWLIGKKRNIKEMEIFWLEKKSLKNELSDNVVVVSVKNFETVLSFLRIWLHLLKKSLMENFIFCAVKFIFSF